MTNQDLVSVIIPIYNAEEYLHECLVSIQRQTYSNIEIICVDDCSTDDSLSIINKLKIKDKRIKVVANSENRGIVYSLNKALKYSRGKIIARMDADDISLSNRIEYQLGFLKQNNLDFVGSKVIYITENGERFGESSFFNSNQIIKLLSYRSTLPHPTWMLYKRVYMSLHGYRNLAPAEDYDFILRATKSGFKLGMHSKALVKFRTQSKDGGTALTNGLVQRKMFNYVYRINKGMQSYSDIEITKIWKTSSSSKKSFHQSQIRYSRAMKDKNQRRIFSFIFNLLYSMLLSPYQAQFIYRAIISKLLLHR